MNAAHWLWAGTGFLVFHEALPSKQHAEFEAGEQFAVAVTKIAEEAANRAEEMHGRFMSFESAAAFLIDRARSSPDRMQPSWWGYEAGIAAGLLGDLGVAKAFLSGITDERVTGHATPLLGLVGHPANFRNRVNELVARQREALDLAALEQPPF